MSRPTTQKFLPASLPAIAILSSREGGSAFSVLSLAKDFVASSKLLWLLLSSCRHHEASLDLQPMCGAI